MQCTSGLLRHRNEPASNQEAANDHAAELQNELTHCSIIMHPMYRFHQRR